MNRYQILCKTQDEVRSIMSYLKSCGYKWNSIDNDDLEHEEDDSMFEYLPHKYVCTGYEEHGIGGSNGEFRVWHSMSHVRCPSGGGTWTFDGTAHEFLDKMEPQQSVSVEDFL